MAYRVVNEGAAAARHRTAAAQGEGQDQTVRLALPARDFLFAQTSIVSSVMLEDNSHLIRPETAQFVNANGDTWSNQSLRANYESFIGAFNFVNHDQRPEKSVGFIADAALRQIWIDPKERIFIYYVDILVATSREFTKLCEGILTSKIEYLSMGCDMEISTCSACGNVAEDEFDLCPHLQDSKGKSFIDKHGVKRVTAEILGNAERGSVVFVEASWLTEPPAFGGAAKRSVMSLDSDATVIVQMPGWAAQRPAVEMWAGDPQR